VFSKQINVWFWGNNSNGQLGNGTGGTNSYLTPTKIPNGSNGFVNGTITAISIGQYGCLALDTTNNVWFWGNNIQGQLGNGGTGGNNSYLTSTKIPNGANGFVNGTITSISISNDGCLAIDISKNVWFWGNNSNGQLGNGTGGTNSYLTPTKIPNGANGFVNGTITAISMGGQACLALDTSKNVWFWGNNGVGQLGNGANSASTYYTPTKIPNGSNGFVNGTITAISILGLGCLAIDTSKYVWFWGDNQSGHLGSGTGSGTSSFLTPTKISGLTNITAISIGTGCLALDTTNNVWFWGNNFYGQLGNSTGGTNSYLTPTKIPNGGNGFVNGTITAISISGFGCLALDTTKNVWFWGNNTIGQLGGGTSSATSYLTPTKIPTGTNNFPNDSINAISISNSGCLAF
jgi:alpha-tubulin suppressor-like RCC1 family protein